MGTDSHWSWWSPQMSSVFIGKITSSHLRLHPTNLHGCKHFVWKTFQNLSFKLGDTCQLTRLAQTNIKTINHVESLCEISSWWMFVLYARSALFCSSHTPEGNIWLPLITASSLTLSDYCLLLSGIQRAGKKKQKMRMRIWGGTEDFQEIGWCVFF